VTALAFYIQNEYNSLSSLLETTTQNEEEDQAQEQAVIEKTFIVQEMLKLAVDLDYADETGRRQMYSLARKLSSLFCHTSESSSGLCKLTDGRRLQVK
jgi:condensin complex subunit 3